MPSQNETFSQEYFEEESTETDTKLRAPMITQEYIEKESLVNPYGLAKPQRRIIKGKIDA